MVKKKERYGNAYEEIAGGPYIKEGLDELVTSIYDLTERFNLSDDGLGSKFSGFFGIGSLVVALYFLTPNFTGNVIGKVDIGTTNLFGSVLFLLGLAGVFVCLRKGK